MKALPVTVSVSSPEPAFAALGRIEASTGAGFAVIVNAAPADVPPPGAGLTTLTVTDPAVATSLAVMAAVNCVELTYVVARFAPFHWTADAVTNPVPFTVSVKAPDPTAAEPGVTLEITGVGFPTRNDTPPEVPPSEGLTTVTVAAPDTATSPARIAAASCVKLTKVVARLAPFHCTNADDAKALPVTVSVKAPEPTFTDAGRIEVTEGVEAEVMVKLTPVEIPPPGVGVDTVTVVAPAVVRSEARIAAAS